MSKLYKTNNTGASQVISETQSEKIKCYPTVTDATSDITNLEDGEIIAVKEHVQSRETAIDKIIEDSPNPVTSNAVYAATVIPSDVVPDDSITANKEKAVTSNAVYDATLPNVNNSNSKIYSYTGKELTTKSACTITTSGGYVTASYDLSGLATGTYFCYVEYGGNYMPNDAIAFIYRSDGAWKQILDTNNVGWSVSSKVFSLTMFSGSFTWASIYIQKVKETT